MNPIGIWFKTDRALPAKKSENPNPGESSAPLSQAINTNMVHYMGVLLIEGPIARGNLSSFHLKSVQFTTVSFPQPPHREIRYGIVMIGECLLSSFRLFSNPDFRYSYNGFRCVLGSSR